jgi:hypothetical protein
LNIQEKVDLNEFFTGEYLYLKKREKLDLMISGYLEMCDYSSKMCIEFLEKIGNLIH